MCDATVPPGQATPLARSASTAFQCIAAGWTAGPGSAEVVFIDPSVPHLDQLLGGVRSDVDAIVLDPAKNALAQMAEALRKQFDLRAIHIIAHGRPGQVSFSSGVLSVESIIVHASDLARLGAALAPEASLALWSCETGLGRIGKAFVEALARATGAEVCASSTLIGHFDLGGAWSLDLAHWALPCAPPITDQTAVAYAGLLNVTVTTNSTVSTSNDEIDVTGSNLTKVTLTGTNDSVVISGSNDSVTISSTGTNDSVNISGSNDTVIIGGSNATMSVALSFANDTVLY